MKIQRLLFLSRQVQRPVLPDSIVRPLPPPLSRLQFSPVRPRLSLIVMTKRQMQALTEGLENLPRVGVRPTGAQAHRVQPMTSPSGRS